MSHIKAEEGIRKILSKLEGRELLSLAATVTQGFLKNKVASGEEAIESIIKYSPDLESILKRKVVTRDILFAYAHEVKAPVILPATKTDVIETLCQFWDLTPNYSVAEVSNVNNQQPFRQEDHENFLLNVSTLAVKFTEWFYAMMNADPPIGSEHFWKDSKLKLHLISSTDDVSQSVDDSPEEIVRLLYEVKCKHRLYFNPNFENQGVQGRIDPHGLVVILTCGTLHTNDTCVGVFEQVFMLAKDPFSDNNWKIKNTELNLRSTEVRELPSLCDHSLTSNLLALPKC